MLGLAADLLRKRCAPLLLVAVRVVELSALTSMRLIGSGSGKFLSEMAMGGGKGGNKTNKVKGSDLNARKPGKSALTKKVNNKVKGHAGKVAPVKAGGKPVPTKKVKSSAVPPRSFVVKVERNKSRQPKALRTLAKDVREAGKEVQQGPAATKLCACPFRVKMRQPYFAMLSLVFLGCGGREGQP